MDLVALLRTVPLFRLLSDDQLALVTSISEQHTVAPGAILCRQADPGVRFFLVESGEAIVHHVDDQGFRRPAGMVRAGESFGVTSLLIGEPRDATITAVTEMRLWTIKRPDFQELLAQHPRLRRALSIREDTLAKLRAPHYPWAEPDEVVIYHSRRHWIVFAPWIVLPTVGALAIVLSLTTLAIRMPTLPRMTWLPPLALGIYVLILLWGWIDWRNDYFVVSSRRVAHCEWSLLRQSREEAPIDRVQNIRVRRGALGGLLNYGDLTITTAAKVGDIHCDRIPHPERMREAIFGQIARLRATRRAAQRHLIRDELISRINLESASPLLDDGPSDRGPIDHVQEPEPPEVQPSRLRRAAMRLAETGIIPRTRIETPESVTWRKHWVFLALSVIPAFVLSLGLGIVTVLGFSSQEGEPPARLLSYPQVTLLLTLLAMAWLWWRFADWANDLYIVTSERIIDIEKRPLFFAQERREASLGMIQNVSLRIPNLVAKVFDYGYVLVQTAGSGDFSFDRVANPREVQREIFRRMESYREAERKKGAARRRAEMGEWLTVYDNLRHKEGMGNHPASVPPTDDLQESSIDSDDRRETPESPPSTTPRLE